MSLFVTLSCGSLFKCLLASNCIGNIPDNLVWQSCSENLQLFNITRKASWYVTRLCEREPSGDRNHDLLDGFYAPLSSYFRNRWLTSRHDTFPECSIFKGIQNLLWDNNLSVTNVSINKRGNICTRLLKRCYHGFVPNQTFSNFPRGIRV